MGPRFQGHAALHVHEVWAWNLDSEFDALEKAVDEEGIILALDTEFPGFLRQEQSWIKKDGSEHYRVVRENVDTMRLIQLGLAVAGADGAHRGAWSFNMSFNVAVDMYSVSSVELLKSAGINFERHAAEGIEADVLGRKLVNSSIVGRFGSAFWNSVPLWVTFSGDYDLGFLLKLLSGGQRLPPTPFAFDGRMRAFIPRHLDLRHHLPHGSLDRLATAFGIRRFGTAHNAGSDALLTLGLYLHFWSVNGSRVETWPNWCNEEPWGFNPYASWDGGCYNEWEDRASRSPCKRMPTNAPVLLPIPAQPHAVKAAAQPTAREARLAAPPDRAEAPRPAPVDAPVSAAAAAAAEGMKPAPAEASTAPASATAGPATASAAPAAAAAAQAPPVLPLVTLAAQPQLPAPDLCTPVASYRAPMTVPRLTRLRTASTEGPREQHWFVKMAPPRFLCLVQSIMLCAVFPPSLDTLLFLPLQVLLVLMLVALGIVPRPPRHFLTAYLAGCCSRLVAVLVWMVWEHF